MTQTLQKIIKVVDREVDYFVLSLVRKLAHSCRHHSKRYSPEALRALNDRKQVIFMADGFRRGSGLADRLRGIVSLFDYCVDNDVDFRIRSKS